MFHDGVHLGEVKQGISEDPGHIPVDLHDQPAAVAGRGADEVIDGPEAEKPSRSMGETVVTVTSTSMNSLISRGNMVELVRDKQIACPFSPGPVPGR